MSETIRMKIEIGGTLPFSLLDTLLKTINDDMYDISDGYTREELINQDPEDCVFISGTAIYGLCERVLDFCKKHDLTYVHHAEAEGEFDATTTYWEPGFEEAKNFKTDSVDNAVVRVRDVEPILNIMCALIAKDKEALPLFLNDPTIQDLVKLGLSDYDKFNIALKERIKSIIPDKPPKVPPFIFDHNK